MSAANHVSRVGGLAVALGLGAAILSGPGTAYADSSESGSSATQSDSSSSSQAAESRPAGDVSRHDSGADESSSASSPESADESSSSLSSPRTPTQSAPTDESRSAGEENLPDTDGVAAVRHDDVALPASDDGADRRTGGRRSATDVTTAERTAVTNATDAAPDTDEVSPLAAATTPGTRSMEPVAQEVAAVAAMPETADVVVGATVSPFPSPYSSVVAVSTVSPSPVESPDPAQLVVSTLLAWTGVAVPGGDIPDTPAPPPAAVAMLAWARRELDVEHAGYSAAAQPIQPLQPIQTVEITQPVPVQPLEIPDPFHVITSLIALTVTTYVDLTSALQETTAMVLTSLVDDLLGHPNQHPGAGAPVVVDAADEAQTLYGEIGKWMLTPENEAANWIGHKYQGRTLYEPINVIIVDPTSTTVEESTQKLNEAMVLAGYGPMIGHTGGYHGLVDGVAYSQQPTTELYSFADDFFLLPNNHGRIFGPAPVQNGTGFIWTAALSRESLGFYDLVPTHVFVSFNRARDGLRDSLVFSGATDLGLVAMDNKLNTATQTTGDHDGYAAVIQI